MSTRLLSDDLWNEIEPLFPVYEPSPKGGRPPIGNRTVFTCLLFVLKTGIAWEDLPLELGASEKTVRRRLKIWSDAGLWRRIFHQLLTRLRAAGKLDLAEVLIDGGLYKAPLGGEKLAPTQRTAVAAAVN
jgi:transposase